MINMDRHAIMMIIHNLFDQAADLVSLMDDERFDFFIHVDAKSDFMPKDREKIQSAAKKSKVIWADRIPVYWGDDSQIQCELTLFRIAAAGEYSYYHLISGIDFPMRSPAGLYEFCQNSGEELVQFARAESQEIYQKRVKYYWILQKRIQNAKTAIKNRNIPVAIMYAVQQAFVLLQKCVGYDRRRKNPGMMFAGGSNWISISYDFMLYILERESWIKETFHHTCCADEMFVQTVMINSPFYEKRRAPEPPGSRFSNMRYIDWKRGRPYTFQNEDFTELSDCGCLFARTIDSVKAPILYRQLVEWYRKQG